MSDFKLVSRERCGGQRQDCKWLQLQATHIDK